MIKRIFRSGKMRKISIVSPAAVEVKPDGTTDRACEEFLMVRGIKRGETVTLDRPSIIFHDELIETLQGPDGSAPGWIF